MRISDWSSDVCSSDLPTQEIAALLGVHILDVALEQFIAHGVEGASMEGIAIAASVSKRTLYSRFGSKTALLVAAVEHGIAHHLRPIASTIPAGSTRAKLLHVGKIGRASCRERVCQYV